MPSATLYGRLKTERPQQIHAELCWHVQWRHGRRGPAGTMAPLTQTSKAKNSHYQELKSKIGHLTTHNLLRWKLAAVYLSENCAFLPPSPASFLSHHATRHVGMLHSFM